MLSLKINHYFKVVLIGDYGVGKSSLIRQYVDGVFNTNHLLDQHIINDMYRHNRQQGDQIIQLQIWDTLGQERYCPLNRQYYRQADGILIVYDVGNRESFDHLDRWLAETESCMPFTCVKILIGNKVDGRREVQFDEANQFATTHDLLFFETSAKLATQVKEAFSTIAEHMTHRAQDQS